MNRTVIVGAVAAVALLGVGLAYKKRQAQVAAAPPAPPPQAAVAPQQVPAAVAPPAMPELPAGATGLLATITAGVAVQAGMGAIADKLAGEGVGAVARIAPVGVGAAAVGGKLVEQGLEVGSSRVDLQACKLEYSIVSPK